MADELEAQDRPSFSGPLLAALRQGSKEMVAVLPAFPDSIQVVNEPGTLGNPTPQLVTEQISAGQDFNRMLDGYAAMSQDGPERSQESEIER